MKPATYALLIANVVVFLVEATYGEPFIERFALWPLGAGFMPWQLVTSGFLHAGTAHLATNMFGLWMFGRDVEDFIGTSRFVRLYGASLLTAGVTQAAVSSALGDAIPSLGASGAVFGVLVSFAMLFPDRRIMLLLPPIPMRARTFVLVYALIELVAGVSGTEAGVAHFAHLGGLAGGYLCIRHWRRPAWD